MLIAFVYLEHCFMNVRMIQYEIVHGQMPVQYTTQHRTDTHTLIDRFRTSGNIVVHFWSIGIQI